MTDREGPSLRTRLSCYGCKWETGKSYTVQSDSGVDYYCQHPSFEKRKYIGGNTDTPNWCPMAQWFFLSNKKDLK